MAQHPLRSIQFWEIHHSPGEIIPMADCSHCEKLSSCAHSEFPQEKFVPIIPCLFHATFCKNGVYLLCNHLVNLGTW